MHLGTLGFGITCSVTWPTFSSGNAFGPVIGQIAAWIVTGVIAFLLLSAVNTAIGASDCHFIFDVPRWRVAAAVRETKSLWGS